jgi:hypothetical protein
MPDDGSHWKAAVDPRSGRTYYYHEITRETQWRKPTELASDSERRAMEDKERKQKEFFAAMEANILKSMSQGVVPGTPTVQAATITRKKSAVNNGPPVTGSNNVEGERDGRPDLVRTISAMDETVLRDIIRRQPSYRNIGTKQTSLLLLDLDGPAGAEEDDGGFGSLSKLSGQLSTLQESNREFEMSTATMSFMFDSPKHGGATMNESEVSGFGLTNEENDALQRLASITQEMIEAEEEEELSSPNGFKGGGGLKPRGQSTPAPAGIKSNKDSKLSRDLPRELDFSDDESDSSRDVTGDAFLKDDTKNTATPFAKGKEASGGRALPRELDFSDTEESEEDSEPTPLVKKRESVVNFAPSPEKPEREKKVLDTFEVRAPTRRNTCGTLYVGTTMSDPDKDATIKVR